MLLKVLYLDDELDLCSIFFDEFSSDEIQVTTFTDPQKAIDSAKSSPPDIIFLDNRMPGASGDDVALAMASDVPKYLITGDISVKTIYKFAEIFHKPGIYDDVRRVLDQFLKAR